MLLRAIFTLLMRGSCHHLSVEIRVKFWVFVFFLIFNWKKYNLKEVQITPIELWSFIFFELRHLNTLKVPWNAKFGRNFFSA
jgi:hypothetical protein